MLHLGKRLYRNYGRIGLAYIGLIVLLMIPQAALAISIKVFPPLAGTGIIGNTPWYITAPQIKYWSNCDGQFTDYFLIPLEGSHHYEWGVGNNAAWKRIDNGNWEQFAQCGSGSVDENVEVWESQYFAVDSAAPVLNIESPNEGEHFETGTIPVKWSVSDTASGVASLTVDGNIVTPVSGEDYRQKLPGYHTIKLVAKDKAGNLREVTRIISVSDVTQSVAGQSTPPSTSLTPLPSSQSQQSSADQSSKETIAFESQNDSELVDGETSNPPPQRRFLGFSYAAFPLVLAVGIGGILGILRLKKRL